MIELDGLSWEGFYILCGSVSTGSISLWNVCRLCLFLINNHPSKFFNPYCGIRQKVIHCPLTPFCSLFKLYLPLSNIWLANKFAEVFPFVGQLHLFPICFLLMIVSYFLSFIQEHMVPQMDVGCLLSSIWLES